MFVIFVKDLIGRTFTFYVEERYTVKQLKTMLLDKEGTNPVMQHLVFEGKTLEDSHVLGHYGIKRDSTIMFVLHPVRGNTLFVRTFAGDFFSIEAGPSLTVRQTKQIIHRKMHFPVASQQLFVGEEELVDERTLESCGVVGGTELLLAFPPPVGGMQVFVKTTFGVVLVLDVQPSYTVLQLKQMIEQKENINVRRQTLELHGDPLPDDLTLEDCNLQPDSGRNLLHLFSS